MSVSTDWRIMYKYLKDDIKDVIKDVHKNKNITVGYSGCYCKYSPTLVDMSQQEINDYIQKEVKELLSESAIEEVRSCLRFLKAHNTLKTKTIRPYTSYWIKSVVELWSDEYISNGSLIVALVLEGYNYEQIHSGKNMMFNISFAKLKKIKSELARKKNS